MSKKCVISYGRPTPDGNIDRTVPVEVVEKMVASAAAMLARRSTRREIEPPKIENNLKASR